MKVYKYRGGTKEVIERDLESLVSNYFWAPTADQLNDPAEAYVNELLIKTTLHGLSSISDITEVNAAFDTVLRMRHTIGVYSLSRTPLDELMWAYYASSHTGFCIEYDLERLKLEARAGWSVIDVSYQKEPQIIQFEDISTHEEISPILGKMIGTKSQRWSHEKEIRIITTNSGKNHYAPPALTGIYFGCRCTDDFITQVRKRLSGRNISYYKVECSPDSYAVRAKPIEYNKEVDGIPETYLASINECYIPELQHTADRHKKYHSYLEKAVEIVSRDPSCDKVEAVDFSGSKIENGKPVIYVTYETNVPTQFDKCLNRYLSLDEIEKAIKDLEIAAQLASS